MRNAVTVTKPKAAHRRLRLTVLACVVASMAACGGYAKFPVSAGVGPAPHLPAPDKSLIPVVNVAEAVGWTEGQSPTPAPGTRVVRFADQLDHPRWLLVLPNGDVLVAESNAPERPEDNKGIKARIKKLMMKKAGAGVPSADRITLLRDADGDGIAEFRSVLLEGLNSPFGMALIEDRLYVANTDSLMRYPYVEGATKITAVGSKLADLPAGPLNHHWTKNVIANADGSKFYVTVGSNSNVAENGIEKEVGRAAIWEVDARTGKHRIFASGLRNPNGLAWEPTTQVLWTVVNERDEIGSDLVPDYLTSVKDGGFYGWPYSYFGQHVDDRVSSSRPDLVARAIVPDYALGPHSAALGLTFAKGAKLPAPFTEGAFVGLHGSWNRRPHSGYKVIFVPFANGKPSGPPIDVLTGFLGPDEMAYGRPVGVAIAKDGSLLVADDVGNAIWRVGADSRQAVGE